MINISSMRVRVAQGYWSAIYGKIRSQVSGCMFYLLASQDPLIKRYTPFQLPHADAQATMYLVIQKYLKDKIKNG